MTSERMSTIIKSISQRVEKLVPSGRFYVVLYEQKKKELSFPLVRDNNKGLSTWDSRPCKSDPVLPDLVITSAKSLLYENDLMTHFEKGEIRYWPDDKNIPQSWLGVPLVVGEQILGALVAESWQKTYSFNKNDESTLATVARQASIAIDNSRLYEQLDRKIENLRILNDFGRQLASGFVRQESDILDLVYASLTKLQLESRNMYIAFYIPDPNKQDTIDEIYGTIRIGLARNIDQKSPMQNRVAQKGLTEYVIRTKKSFSPPDVQLAYQKYAPDSIRRSNSPRPRSWLGVPIISEQQVLGAIVLRDYEFEKNYTDDDREIVEILARQVATALNSLKVYQMEKEIQEEKNAAENMAIMGLTAAEFAHKMNNLAGTIPVRIKMAKDQLNARNPKEAKVIEQLSKIEEEADGILKAAQEIRQSSEPRAPEEFDVHQLLEVAITRAKNAHQNVESKVEVFKSFSQDLPIIKAERNSFLDTLTSIIKNGIESIEVQGSVTIKTCRVRRAEKDFVEIIISDTGKGIPSSDLAKIFDLFYTTKRGKGLGFGLWRDRVFVKKLGGEIDVQSELGRGSTFTIYIPVAKKS